jgi:hypothetical protein
VLLNRLQHGNPLLPSGFLSATSVANDHFFSYVVAKR